MTIHKRSISGMCFSLCKFYRHISWDGIKFCDWYETSWFWNQVTCKKCIGLKE